MGVKLDRVSRYREASIVYKYMVVCRCGSENVYFPSNSRDASKHINENGAKYCWIYDKDGWLISRAEINEKAGKTVRLPLNLDGEPRTQFVDMLNKFNALNKLNFEILPVVSHFTSGAALSLDELIAQANDNQSNSRFSTGVKQTELYER